MMYDRLRTTVVIIVIVHGIAAMVIGALSVAYGNTAAAVLGVLLVVFGVLTLGATLSEWVP